MPVTLLVHDFINEVSRNNLPVIDVRSPAEFCRAHFPAAHNMPLLNNQEREIIGTTYKHKGREEAVQKGFELVGPRFHQFIDDAKKISSDKIVAIYCWRGGMRSGIIAWLLTMAGFKTILLKGGYKSFRKWTRDKFADKKNIIVLGGKTGSGKTEVLTLLKQKGEQIIDLEKLANHKGSAFGGLGKGSQPTCEQFENLLALEWNLQNAENTLWVENESRSIGKIVIPEMIYAQMRNAPVVEINLANSVRKKRILREYGFFSKEELIEKTKAITKRLGFDVAKKSVQFLEENNFDGWCDNMMLYYDKTYSHSSLQRSGTIVSIELNNDDFTFHINAIIEMQKTIAKSIAK